MILEDNKVAVFRAVVRCGGVTAASRELGVSQPAVSQALAELESSLGTRLLKRDKSGIELTPDGALFLSYAERAGKLSAEVEALFAPEAERKAIVSAPAYIASIFLEPLKERFAGRFELETVPEGDPADIEIVTTPAPEAIPLGRIDMSFTDFNGVMRSSEAKRVYALVSDSFAKSPLCKIIIGILGGKL